MNARSILRPLGGWPYFWWGCILMAVKYNLDRVIAWEDFHRQWYLWNYVAPRGLSGLDAVPPDDAQFYYYLVLTSLPFAMAGIWLTLRRLHSAGLPLWLSVLFFAPVINLIFFVVLCIVPDRDGAFVSRPPEGWLRYLPTSAIGSALLSVGVVGVLGVLMVITSTQVLQVYGSGLFVGEPFAMGLVSVLIYAGPAPRNFLSCVGVALLTTAIVGVLLLVVAVEGLICLLMAAPIACFMAFFGGCVGYIIVRSWHGPVRPASALLVFLSVPFLTGMERQADVEPPLLSVTSSVMINAPPDKVWPNVIAFSRIPDERDWVLRTGISYPIRARIDGAGVGAIRHCIFTTGEFVEPIEVWDSPHLLRFSVAAQPEPMEELSPYPHLKTPHLDSYFASREGELRLTALPGGRTLLSGTTWYTDKVCPSDYWQLWSDMIIHHIHLRVLNHIKALSEQTSAAMD